MQGSQVQIQIQNPRELGFTGSMCGSCSSMSVKQNGTCSVCMDCGDTTGCS